MPCVPQSVGWLPQRHLAPVVFGAVHGALEDASSNARLQFDVQAAFARHGVSDRPPGVDSPRPGIEAVLGGAVHLKADAQCFDHSLFSSSWSAFSATLRKRAAASPHTWSRYACTASTPSARSRGVLGPPLEAAGELLERRIQFGNRSEYQRCQQACVGFAHGETHPILCFRPKRECPFAGEQAQRHAAGPAHGVRRIDVGDGDWEGAAGVDAGDDGDGCAGGNAPVDANDAGVPAWITGDVGEDVPDALGRCVDEGGSLVR